MNLAYNPVKMSLSNPGNYKLVIVRSARRGLGKVHFNDFSAISVHTNSLANNFSGENKILQDFFVNNS